MRGQRLEERLLFFNTWAAIYAQYLSQMAVDRENVGECEVFVAIDVV
jgi:hypothetical protein